MIRFAIVGCGHIASKHIEAINNTQGAQLIAICDTNPDRFSEISGSESLACYTDFQQMLVQESKVDVVCICTPSGLHAKLAVAAANAGKHLIIEKPITLTLEDTDEIIQVATRNNVKVAVVHPNRFRPAIKKLKYAIEQGIFGRLSHVSVNVRWNRSQAYYDQAAWRGTRLLDGGVLMNQAIHSLDLLQWLVGPVDEVKSMLGTRLRDIEAEDVAIAALRFSNGVMGAVEATTTIYGKNFEETISIFGEHGYAVIGGRTANWIKHWSCSTMSQEDIQSWISEVEHDPFGIPGHQVIIQDMVMAITDNRQPIVNAYDGKQALKLVLDMYKSDSWLFSEEGEKIYDSASNR